MESPIITKSILAFFASLSFSWCSLGMNFFRGDGTGMTVEGFSPNAAEDIQNDRNNTVRRREFLIFMIIFKQLVYRS
jgi:hypothetical protein